MKQLSADQRRQRAIGFGLSAVALLFAAVGELIDPPSWTTPTQSPTLFPALALFGVIWCGLVIAFTARDEDARGTTNNWYSVIIGVIVAAYAIALPITGFAIATIALSFGLPFFLGYRNWIATSALAAGILGMTWLIFVRTMNVPLKL